MKLHLIWGCLLVAFAQAADAQPRDQYDPRDQVTIDSARSYVFYRTNLRGAMLLLREVSDSDREATRIASFTRARATYERRQAQWERSRVRCQREPTPDCPERPQEVTLETFPDPAPDSSRWVEIWWQPRFTAGDEGNSYFRALEPGSYILYGNVMLGNNGSGMGVCLCMGSLRFEARPGEIVDLGEIRYTVDPTPGRTERGVTVVPYAPTMTVPARLAGLPRAPAEFHAAGKLPNYLGVEIERHPALAGVLDYERDQVIDVRTGSRVPPAH
jgi:hypothetical protein